MFDQSFVSASKTIFASVSASTTNPADKNLNSSLASSRRGQAWTRGVASFAAALMLVGAFCVAAQAQVTQVTNWNQQFPATSPSARWDGAMAYDSAHSQVVMFGGLGNPGTLSETWLWNGTTWSQANPATVPPARANQAMTYDALHGQVVMFGGINTVSTRTNDTWLWNGTNWTQVVPASSPPARAAASMVYDAALGEVVLFGGLDINGSPLGDTWLWNGTTWSQASPATSPDPRYDYAMAYDAVHSQVVLFGGLNGAYLSDTWLWNGSTWTQQVPALSPGARYGHGMDFDPALGQVVMFGGYSGSTYLSDTWSWNGTNWTEQSFATNPALSYATNSMVYDAAEGSLVLFEGYDGDTEFSYTFVLGTSQNFGSVNVCPTGQSTPVPCSATLALTYGVSGATSFDNPQVVVQGAAGADFTLASGSTCVPGPPPLGYCSVNVTFTPQAPGLRLGAVQIFDNGGTLLTTTPIYGVGQAAEIAFGPGSPALVNLGGSYSFSFPVAVDAGGNIYFTAGGQAYKKTSSGVQTLPSAGQFFAESGIAVDGAGDVFVADNEQGRVFELPANGGAQRTSYPPQGNFGEPRGVAVDGQGDIFVADSDLNEVVEVPANGGSNVVVYGPPSSGSVGSVAVDGAGDLFVALDFPGSIVKIPAGCSNIGCQKAIGTGWIAPASLAVDAAGSVYVADPELASGNGEVVQVPPGCTSSVCQYVLANGNTISGGVNAESVAVDGQGNVFYINTGSNESGVGSQIAQLYEIVRSQPPSLSFSGTNVGFTSIDSPQSFTALNVGNQTLSAILPGFAVPGVNFAQVSSSGQPVDCLFNFSLTPGAECNVSINFMPQVAGNLTGTGTFTDNNLNGNPATQTIALSGTGFNGTQTLNLTGAGTGSGSVVASPTGINCNILAGVASGPTCSSGYVGGEGVSLEEVPTSGSTFTGWGGDCASAGASQFCNINLNILTSTNVSASFTANSSFPLQVTEMGTGAGTVSSSPGGIACSLVSGAGNITCSSNFTSGTQVVLTEIGSGNSIFTGWGGDCAGSGASPFCIVTVDAPMSVTASFVAPGANQPGALMPITAGIVYGQGGSFTSTNGGVGAGGLNNPVAVAVDSNGGLYVADRSNNRVLYYPAGSTTATRVYGQSGSFTSNGVNTGGVTANSLNQPWAVAVDSSNNLYIADQFNYRVLYYPAGSTTATRVYGQNGSFTSAVSNNGGISANSLSGPQGLAVDSGGNLYVSDGSRVLFFPAGATTATRVYGQGGSFTTNTANNGGVSANSLDNANGLVVDSSGDLYVAELYNNRVLFFPAGSTTATRVYGQNGSFTSNIQNNGGVSANSLYQPQGLALDSGGNLYVAEYGNTRVLFYPFASTTATRVYGQNGSTTSSTQNNGGVSANSVNKPTGVALDANGNVYVADIFNNRVLEFGSFGNVNVCPSGVSTPAPCNTTVTMSYYAATATTFGASQVVTQGFTGLDFSLASGGTCTGTVTAGSACTVNVNFAPLAPGSRTGAVQLYDNAANLLVSAPLYGIGQAPVIAFGPGAQTVLPFTGLNRPSKLALDAAGDLFVIDYANDQVVKLTPGNVQTTVPTSGLSNPTGVAVDGAGDLFIVDNGNVRVVEIPAGCTTAVCQVTVPVTGLSNPYDVAMDGAGDLFIADAGIPGVVKFTSSGVQTMVPASGLFGPFGVAVDAAGDVFIADTYATSNGGTNQVVEVTAGGVQTTVPTVGVTSPEGVWVDAAGDVFIADWIGNNRIVEVPAGGGVQTLVYSGTGPEGVVTDGAGDIVIADTFAGRVVVIGRSQPSSLSFALTNVGTTSVDSPQVVSAQNVGNQPLTGSLALNVGANFAVDTGSNCPSFASLSPGASCNLNFSFTPQTTGFLTGTASFSDNTFNLSPLVSLQTVNLSGSGGLNGQPVGVLVPNVVGLAQTAATTPITAAGLALGTVSTASSSVVPSGSVIATNPPAGTQVVPGSAVRLLVSNGQATPPTPNPLSLENNYFITGDYASAGVTLRGHGIGGVATGTITIPSSTANPGVSQGVPDGADIVDGFLYWETLENTPTPTGGNGTFLGYPISGQQIGSDLDNYTDGTFTGTLRVYRADVNTYFPGQTSGVRFASGSFTVSLPDSGGTGFPLTEGASLVVIYRVLSPNFPLKSVVIYDGSAIPAISTTQNVQGFYDALGGTFGTGESTTLFAAGGSWNNSSGTVTTPAQSSQFNAPLNAGSAYAAVILSTPVANSDNDGILDSWKAGPTAGDFYAGQPGYYDVKSGSWVPLPGAKHGEKDLFVQMDYMCGSVLPDGSCASNQENLFPSPDSQGNDPLAIVTSAFAADGVVLHLEVGNAVPEDICTDNASTPQSQLCQFPNQPGVIGWKNSLEFSKLWPKNLASCAAGGDCSPRFPYGQKDSYHYVLFGRSLAIPAWNSRYGTLTSINVVSGVTTIGTTDRGSGINECPSRITISGVLGNPSLNGVYNTNACPDSKTITVTTPGVPNWSYPNSTLPEPVIGLTSGTVTSISGYSDLGGADSAVTLGLWETAPNQNMSKRANVIAGTLFHEIGHTLGLSHGGLYYQTPGSYIPTFDVNCKPNYQSVMNYLFQLDGVGSGAAVAYSNQTLQTLKETSLASVTNLTDGFSNAATFSTSAWYTPTAPSPTASAATLHCDGTTLGGDTGYRVNGSIAPVTPSWSNGQNITFDGVPYTQMLGYNDVANMDLRQVGATGGEFASLASVLTFGSSQAPLQIAAGGSATVGAGGVIALGSGGTVTLGSGRNVTMSSAGTITLGSGGTVTLGSGRNVTIPSTGGTVTPGSDGIVTLGSGGNVTLGSGGTITMGSGGIVTLGSGGTITLGSGGTIALGSGLVTIPHSGGSYTLPTGGGIVTLGSGGTIALGSGGNVTLGSGGIIALGSGGTVTLGSGGNVTLGSGGIIALGSGGTIALGSGGNVTLGSGGTIALGSGGNVTLGSGGNVTLGSGGIVTLGSGGNVTLGSGGNVTLGSGGTVTLGSGGTVALGSGGNVTLGSGGTIAFGSGGTVTLGSGGTITLGSGGIITLGSGGSQTSQTVGPGMYAIPAGGGIITLGSGGNVTLSSGGNVTLGSGGIITMGSGGTVTLGSGGNVTLGSGGVVALGSGGNVTLGSGGNIALGSGGNVTLGSGGASTDELTYETANSIVRPPSSPTETPASAGTAVVVNWTAPVFGVVSTYTISRSSNGGTPIVIGSVSGVNGNPPATTFTDTNPDLTSQTVVYTISTTLLPVAIDPTPRQSAPSTPAVLTNDQSIVLGSLPSSVPISNATLTVTATAQSSGAANGLQVNFSAAGSCTAGSESIDPTSGISSVIVTLNTTGSCNITASQPGSNLTQLGNPPYYNPANSVSGTVMVLPQGSNLQSQTILFPQLPSVQYGSTFLLSASSSSGLAVGFSASGPCTTGGSISGVGVCTITASAPASPTYSAASVVQSFNINPAVLKVIATNVSVPFGQPIPALTSTYSGFVNNEPASVVSGAPALSTTAIQGSNPGNYPITVSTGTLAAANYSFLYVPGTLTIQSTTQAALILNTTTPLTYNQSETLSVSGGTTNGAVTYNLTGGPCTISGAHLTANSGTGACTLTATMAGNSSYGPITSNPATVTLSLASQTITFTSNPPPSATFNSSFTVAATGGASGNAVTFTSSGACSNSGATYTMTSGTGTCSVIANQAGNTNYSAALLVTKTVNATGPAVTVSPSSINFGTVTLGSITTKNITVTNTGTASVTVTDPILSIVHGGNSNEFVAVNLCLTPLAAGKSCTITIAFVAGPFYTPQTATLQIMDNAPGSPQPVTLSATVLIPQTITFTTGPPASAAYHSSFTVAATGGASGNPVTFTSSGACSNSGATFTMTSGTGTCSVIANQSGNSTYAAASQVTKNVTATLIAQAITFTTSPPVSAAYKSTFTVVATGGASGNPVTFTSSGACSNSGATFTMSSGTGTCSVIANQAGNSSYSAAPSVTKSATATVATQAITFTSNPPASAAYKSTFTVAATGGGSGNAVTFTSSGSCSNSGATYTMTSGTGTCSVIANQAGNTNYSAAAAVTKTLSATPVAQTITFTTNPPSSASHNTSFTVAATGGASGNAVTFTSSGVCTNSGAKYTMTSSTGTCSVIANQAGNSNYTAAATVTKTVTAKP